MVSLPNQVAGLYGQLLSQELFGSTRAEFKFGYNGKGYAWGYINNRNQKHYASKLYFSQDAQNSTIKVSGENAEHSYRYAYTPFGQAYGFNNRRNNEWRHQFYAQDYLNAHAVPYLYTGKYTDPLTGMANMDARWYDARTARFNQPDQYNHANLMLPAGAQSELMRYIGRSQSDLLRDPAQQMRYGYVSGNALRWVDPLGLCDDGFWSGVGNTLFNVVYEPLATVYDIEQVAYEAGRSLITGEDPRDVQYASAIGRSASTGNSSGKILGDMAIGVVTAPYNAGYKIGTGAIEGNSELIGEGVSELGLMLVATKGTTPGKPKPVVEAEVIVGNKSFKDVNQTARNNGDPNTPTAIAERISAKEAKKGEKLPNGNMATAHAEIGAMQQALDAGITQGADMVINVSGKPVCGFCIGDVAAMAKESGLNSLTLNELATGNTFSWQTGMRSIK